MTVAIVILIGLAIFWSFASKDFAIYMTAFAFCFAIAEGISIWISGKTITRKFYEWSDTVPKWRIWLVSVTITLIAIYFTLHLAIGI
ncbi:MAG: hypothetical protein GY699_09470 [Desulfobacteraceae bacterium]|nr:hypothetical protein [Desulfobacteraceae bacterium]